MALNVQIWDKLGDRWSKINGMFTDVWTLIKILRKKKTKKKQKQQK